MVYYFKSRSGEYTIYMGKDKYENEDLIKYGHPEDVWFHVDDLSSAHVYLRMKPGMTMDDITEDLILDCSALVKANSIAGCKVGLVAVQFSPTLFRGKGPSDSLSPLAWLAASWSNPQPVGWARGRSYLLSGDLKHAITRFMLA